MPAIALALVVGAVGCRAGEPSRPVVRSHTWNEARLPPPARVPVEEPYAAPESLEGALSRDIVCWTNVERMARGLAPVTWSETLARAARAHSDEMARLGYFDHFSPTSRNRTLMNRVRNAGLRARSLLVGENLAKGNWSHDRARRIVEAWMESDGHRENLLRPSFRRIGVGVVWDGRDLIATQVFGTSG